MTLDAFQDRLGHRFHDAGLLKQALTHGSAAGEPGGGRTNERLEFLGDRVLGLCMAELLFERFPGETEGHLGRRFGVLVSRDTLADVARGLGVPDVLVIPPSQRHTSLKDNPTALADAMEAILAAVHLDAGLDAARRVVRAAFEARVLADSKPPRPAKTRLQEWLLKRGLGLPAYMAEAVNGEGHPERYLVTVIAAGREAQARGPSKRVAEAAAAEDWLREVER